MSPLNIINGGILDYISVFVHAVCPSNQQKTPHTQRRLLAHWPGHRKGAWHVLVRCGSCGLEHVWYTNEIPDGLQPFHVRVHAATGPHPLGNGMLPELTEEFMVLATDRQAAYRQSQFSREMPTAGQFVTTYVDGAEERDERF